MIFNRLVTKFLSFLFSHKHTLISAITLAVPLFPSKVKRFLQIPRTINRFAIRGKFTMLEALVSHTPRTFTLCYTRPVNRISVAGAGVESSDESEERDEEQKRARGTHLGQVTNRVPSDERPDSRFAKKQNKTFTLRA